MAIEKYRVHEVAKDFGLSTKTITEILTKYATAPKNHMQVLDDHELSIIFDYLTQHNQVSGIQVIFADTYQEKKKEEPPAVQPAPQSPAQPKPQGQKAAPSHSLSPSSKRAARLPGSSLPPRSSRLPGSPEENCGHPQRR